MKSVYSYEVPCANLSSEDLKRLSLKVQPKKDRNKRRSSKRIDIDQDFDSDECDL